MRYAGQLASELQSDDFDPLRDLVPPRSVKWQEHFAEALGLVRDPRLIPLLFQILSGEATAAFAAAQTLRGIDRSLSSRADEARMASTAAAPATRPRHRLHQLVIANFLAAAKNVPGSK